jgi:hypothetical protein
MARFNQSETMRAGAFGRSLASRRFPGGRILRHLARFMARADKEAQAAGKYQPRHSSLVWLPLPLTWSRSPLPFWSLAISPMPWLPTYLPTWAWDCRRI